MAEQQTRFVGTYEHGLDDKGRMVLPSKIRAQLGETAMVAMADRCLGLWTMDGFDAVAAELADRVRKEEVPADVLRIFMAYAAEVAPDQQGRIVIPYALRKHAGLSSEVVVNGRRDRAEIWAKAAWDDLVHPQSEASTETTDVGDAFAALRL